MASSGREKGTGSDDLRWGTTGRPTIQGRETVHRPPSPERRGGQGVRTSEEGEDVRRGLVRVEDSFRRMGGHLGEKPEREDSQSEETGWEDSAMQGSRGFRRERTDDLLQRDPHEMCAGAE